VELCWRTIASPPSAPTTRHQVDRGKSRASMNDGGRKKIIIVDDDRETREMLKMALELEATR